MKTNTGPSALHTTLWVIAIFNLFFSSLSLFSMWLHWWFPSIFGSDGKISITSFILAGMAMVSNGVVFIISKRKKNKKIELLSGVGIIIGFATIATLGYMAYQVFTT